MRAAAMKSRTKLAVVVDVEAVCDLVHEDSDARAQVGLQVPGRPVVRRQLHPPSTTGSGPFAERATAISGREALGSQRSRF